MLLDETNLDACRPASARWWVAAFTQALLKPCSPLLTLTTIFGQGPYSSRRELLQF